MLPTFNFPHIHTGYIKSILCGGLFFQFLLVQATNYYVSTTGIDTSSRDGKSSGAAWKTLAYACERVPEGSHTIILSPGTYQETSVSYPKSGVRILGYAHAGSNKTTIKAPANWSYRGNSCEFPDTNVNYIPDGYLIKVLQESNVTISQVEFEGGINKAHGAIFANRSDNVTIDKVAVRNFSFSGAILNLCTNSSVKNSSFYNSASTKICDASKLGGLTTRYLSHSEISGNYFKTDKSKGYGYRGRGHENVKIYDNTFDIHGGYFDIEIAHFHEFGAEIYNNSFRGPVSVPKEGGQQNPQNRGYEYSIHIHDNTSTSAYAIEGSRSYLEIDHNIFLSTTSTGGRIYSDFGVRCDGPVNIHHNIVESADRGFIFKQDGYLNHLNVYNNTVYLDDSYNNYFIDTYRTTTSSNWEVKNNIVVAPASKPGYFKTGTTVKNFVAEKNVYQNINDVPSGNYERDPGLNLSGDQATSYYYPSAPYSFVVDNGIDVGLSFKGSAPDIGALEFDSQQFNDEAIIIGLQNKSSNHYLRYQNNVVSMYNLTPSQVQNWDSHKFHLTILNDGSYALKHISSGKYLWYKNHAITMINLDANQLQQYSSHKFLMEILDDGYLWIKHKNTGLYLYDKLANGLQFLPTVNVAWNGPKWTVDEISNPNTRQLTRTNMSAPTGTTQDEFEKLSLYPNPVTGKLIIDINPSTRLECINLYSIEGALMNSIQVNDGIKQKKIDMSYFKPGIYIIHVYTEQSKERFTILKN